MIGRRFSYAALLLGVFTGSANAQSTGKASAFSQSNEKPQLVFKNGFEGTTQIVRFRTNTEAKDYWQKDKFIGSDDPAVPSDWVENLHKGTPYFSETLLNYEQGDATQRLAEIVPDPADPANKVVRFRITDQHITLRRGQNNVERKARIQLELFNRKPAPPDGYLREYYQSCRLYFSPTFKVLEDVPSDEYMGWFVMQEFWNDPSWNAPGKTSHQGARTGIEVVRYPNKQGGKLRFGAKGRDPVMEVPRPGNNSWEVIDTDFAIPLGQWMTQEIYVKEGNSQTGRFYMSITVDGKKHVIVDHTGMTTSEAPGYVPDGQTSWSPFKVYTQGKVATWFKQKNVPMDVYWDDLEIWINKRP